jgi:predicted GNAT family N-acyltransferase
MDSLEIRPITSESEYTTIRKIRHQVFVNEQQVPENIEFDGLDSKAEHFIAFLGEKAIGCARIRTNKFTKLERIAILNQYRKKGYGTKLTQYLINYCKQKHYQKLYLHAQLHLKDFYKKIGFQEKGKIFLEAGIRHVAMFLTL